MAKEIALTTTDNPYDPFTQFRDWYAFDTQMGYNTCAYLDRIAKTSNGVSDEVNENFLEQAIDEIVGYNLNGKYKKVVKS